MYSLQPSNPTTAGLGYSNTVEAGQKHLKTASMEMTVVLKEEINKVP